MRTFLRLLCLVSTLALSGCDALTGTTTTVYGTVTDKRTGAPIEGISVALVTSGGFGLYVAEASTVTDAQGRYRLSTDFDRANGIDLFVNQTVMSAVGNYDAASWNYVNAFPGGRMTRRDSNSVRQRWV